MGEKAIVSVTYECESIKNNNWRASVTLCVSSFLCGF